MLGSAEAAAATGGGGKQVTEGFSRAQHTKLTERPTHHRLGFSGYRA